MVGGDFMLGILIIGFLIMVFLMFLVAIPVAIVKGARTKKQPCPYCKNEIRFISNYGKCPKCRTKIYKHGDGTLQIRT